MSKQIPLKVVDDGGMYQSAPKVYPREVEGRFQRLRTIAVWVLLGLFYVMPWVNWEGRQAVLFDLPARKFYILGLSFWPQDFVFLAMLLMIAAFALFFFTALAGRLWCGYACPQTVWTEAFIAMERWCEGDRGRQMKLDAGPWNRDKIIRKFAKHTLWIVFALWTGFTFVGFFTPIRTLALEVSTLSLGGWEWFWTLFYSLATWGNAGFLREQVCTYMCPYARFQGAMFDRDTLIIAYDTERGEPRGSRRKGVPSVLELPKLADGAFAEGAPKLGDCIDCTICVQVCPTGIDIRDGLQYECIACGACVDACDNVMDRLGYPRGLVRYATLNSLEHKTPHVIRPRIIVYGFILLALIGGFTYAVFNRTPLIIDVLRDRNALYRELGDGAIENAYTFKIVNKDQVAHRYVIRISEGGDGLALSANAADVAVDAEGVANVAVTVQAAGGSVKGQREIVFEVRALDGDLQRTQKSRFFGPI
ncbi:MAG TPA: cytochrome c oxidase accessory protein CcoG [Patescibacteria group bacterium]|nr:cytochrome c oxidase accessory protein CcoG [Patescibacteria group bacterium]